MSRPLNSLDQLRVLVAVAQCRGFSAAARQLSLTQPGVSKQIRALERHFGLPLVERQGRLIGLNQHGQAVYESAVKLLHEAEQLEVCMQEQREGRAGRLAISANMTFGDYVLPTILASFRATVPSAEVTLSIGNTDVVYAAVQSGAADLGIASGPDEPEGLVVERLCRDQVVLFVAGNHPLLAAQPARPRDLEEFAFILPLRGTPAWRSRLRLLAENGIQPRRVIEIGHPEAMKRTVAAGTDICMLGRQCLDGELASGSLAALDVPGVNFEGYFQLFYRADRYMTRLMKKFREYLRQAITAGFGL